MLRSRYRLGRLARSAAHGFRRAVVLISGGRGDRRRVGVAALIAWLLL
jgi:hypothetical protein